MPSSFTSRRSASVRVQASSHGGGGGGGPPPFIQRSSSVSTSIQIGSKGSIFSLIGGDLSHPTRVPPPDLPQHLPSSHHETLRNLSSSPHGSETMKKLPSSHSVHHETYGKLSSVQHGYTNSHTKLPPSSLESVGESTTQKKVPRWKKLLKRLIKGGLRIGEGGEKEKEKRKKAGYAGDGDGGNNTKGMMGTEDLVHGGGGSGMKSEEMKKAEHIDNGDAGEKIIRLKEEEEKAVGNRTAHHQHSSSSEYGSRPNLSSYSPDPQRTSPIWERRNFSGIKPLDLSKPSMRSKPRDL